MRRSMVPIIIVLVLGLTSIANAQVRINVHVNIGSQPIWGPVGYDYVDYYYMPDLDVYYSVPLHRYYYNRGGRWVGVTVLPPQYRRYDLNHTYKVVVNEREPWRHHAEYREKYRSYRGRHDQEVIRDSHDSKYFVVRGHPEHDKWVREQKHDNGKHNGNKEHGKRGH
jgi:hypothetical protein